MNLIGHSQGGIDTRYVAAMRPEWIASVTTYATPNRGTVIADVILGLVDDPRFSALADALVRVIGAPLWDAAGEESSVFEAMRQLSVEGMDTFNRTYRDSPAVAYYSLSGRSDRHLGGDDCQATDSPDFITRYRDERDPIDPLLDIPEQITDGGLENVVNDGLVRARDARWGRFLGCVPADHLDEVGHLLGDSPGLFNDFDHLELFRALVAFLHVQGY